MIRDLLVRIFGWRFDWPEFLIGFAVGGVAALFLGRLALPVFRWGWQWARQSLQELRESFTATARDQYRDEIIARASASHVAQALFDLEDISIPPRVLAPPPPTDPSQPEAPPTDTLAVLPNLPDWTTLAGVYQPNTLTLGEALAGGAHLLVTGPPGSGKTTALAHLAIQAARREPSAGEAAQRVPVLIHAADLRLEGRLDQDPLEPLIGAAQAAASPGLASKLPGYLRLHFRQGHALLLLDGLDEFPTEDLEPLALWLQRLIEAYPHIRIVAAGPVRGYDGLVSAGLAPVTLSPWGPRDQREFLNRWGAAWQQRVAPSLPKDRLGSLDPALLSGWLAGSLRTLTPLEITLKTWAAFAGDLRGPRMPDAFASYIGRTLAKDEAQAAEAAALAWLEAGRPAIPERSLRRGTPVGDLVAAGILVRRAGGAISFFSPAVGGYLGARAMSQTGLNEFVAQGGWPPAEEALAFYAALAEVGPLVEQRLQEPDEPLHTNVLSLARWVRDAPGSAPWRPQVLRALAKIAEGRQQPYGLRLRAVHALVHTLEPSVAILFRRMLSVEDPASRVLAAVGLGGARDQESVDALLKVVREDRELIVRQAGCLALAGIGAERALEGLGRILLEGEEDVRLAAAESLACHPEDGFSMLKEAAEHENLLTRRAALFGLGRVPEPWALEILDTVQVEDKQWVVRGAAAEVAERRRNPPWKVVPPLQEPSELGWLATFASNQGLGVAPGKAALEMVRRALSSGSTEEKIAALEALAWAGSEEFSLDLYHALGSSDPYLRDAAFEAIWRLTASGVELPSPVQSGPA